MIHVKNPAKSKGPQTTEKSCRVRKSKIQPHPPGTKHRSKSFNTAAYYTVSYSRIPYLSRLQGSLQGVGLG